MATGIAAGLGIILCVPFDYRIVANGRVDFADAVTIYVPATATLTEISVDFGETVRTGQLLFALTSPELSLQRETALAEVRKLEISRASYQRRATNEPELHAVLALQDEQLKLAKETLNSVERQLEELQLCSSRPGVVFPLLNIQTLEPLSNLLGSTQESGASLCRIANPKNKQVLLKINAMEHSQIRVGKPVRIQVESLSKSLSGGVVQTKVLAISPIAPHESTGGIVGNTTEPQSEKFEVICELSEPLAMHVPVGSQVSGVFHGKTVRILDLIVDRVLGKIR